MPRLYSRSAFQGPEAQGRLITRKILYKGLLTFKRAECKEVKLVGEEGFNQLSVTQSQQVLGNKEDAEKAL